VWRRRAGEGVDTGHQRQHSDVLGVSVRGGRERSSRCRHRDPHSERPRPRRGPTPLLHDPLGDFAGQQQQVQDQLRLRYVTLLLRLSVVF